MTLKLQTLVDSRAEGYIFVNRLTARKLVKKFRSIRVFRFRTPYRMNGFSGSLVNTIIYTILTTLNINGHRIEVPILVIDIGKYNIILRQL